MIRYFVGLACVGSVVFYFFHATEDWERYAAVAFGVGAFVFLAGLVQSLLVGVAAIAFTNTDLGSDSMVDFVLWPMIGVGCVVYLLVLNAAAAGAAGFIGGDGGGGGGGDFGGDGGGV